MTMRPALQRLLARPSSLEFLRTLVGTPAGPAPERTRVGGCEKRRQRRAYGTAGLAVKEADDLEYHHEHTISTTRSTKTQHVFEHSQDGLGHQEGVAFDPQQLLQAGDKFLSKEEEGLHDEIFLGKARRRGKQPLAILDRGLWTGDFLAEGENDATVTADSSHHHMEASVLGVNELRDKSDAKRSTTTKSTDSSMNNSQDKSLTTPGNLKVSQGSTFELITSKDKEVLRQKTLLPPKAGRFGPWEKHLSSHKRLEFESSLDTPVTSISARRLVDTKAYKDDLRLWACLLTYRKRVHGREGALMFWNAIRRRDLHLPCSLTLGDAFWPTFLDLGFEDVYILEQLCDYADKILERSNERWHGLYSHVIEHFLINGDGATAILWHQRLFARHPPGANRFARMCRQVAFRGGDLQALKAIYKETGYRNAYSKIIPVLCAKEEFKSALDWHYTFLEHGDLPSAAKLVEPLVHFLAVYYPPQATRLTKSLVDAGASFAPTLPTQVEINTKISREMMNLVHGKDLNVPPKKYSDSLGARWFATTWVSLDTAISTVHALGVREIGPLSLQAIALRDSDPKSITARISQLQFLGISIGRSLFSRAVEHFANPRNRKEESLRGLLNSDQHPDELENGELQEALLATYAQAKDWTQYRRTIEIRSLASRTPKIEAANIILRGLILRRNMSAIFHQLEDMQLQGVPVKTFSTKILLRHILHERSPGKRPSVHLGQKNHGAPNDLETAIAVLKKIMVTGSYVPVTQWREIVRRLGMLGKFQDLRALCIYLAEWYGPKRIQHGWYRVPAELSTKHLLHPLSILFSPSLQKALVEWGFIAALKREPHAKLYASHKRLSIVSNDSSALPDVVAGIKLLKKLSKHGVYIRGTAVRKGIFNRLVAYYGPGRSNRRHNRWGQEKLAGRMPEVAENIDAALGGDYFTSPEINLEARVRRMALGRMEHTTIRRLGMRHKRYERRTLDPKLLQIPRQRPRLGS